MASGDAANGVPEAGDAGPSKTPHTFPKQPAKPATNTFSPPAGAALAPAASILSPPLGSEGSPRSSIDHAERVSQLEAELALVRQEKDVLGNQYRTLLGKLTAMRTSLGEKLREDAEELDRRETAVNALTSENAALQTTISTLQTELASSSEEASILNAQLMQLRSQSDSSSSDVLSLTREMRELRGEMERLRVEREEWEAEAGRERERREAMEEDVRQTERRERERRREWERGMEELAMERERARNLQEVLSEFQAAKDSELRQATSELETQLKLAATSLSEYKLRAANAETRLSEASSNATRSTALEKEIKEKNQLISKLRHDAVVNNEHLTEALRRLRKNTSDNNVDKRLVNNILLAFLSTSRADSKRFEMLSLLSTILGWDDREREKAGLQRIDQKGAKQKSGAKPGMRRKDSAGREERSAEEEAAMNESFSNLFVEFLLKEASQGQPPRHDPESGRESPLSPLRSPSYVGSTHYPSPSIPSSSPPATGASTPYAPRQRTFSSGSARSVASPPQPAIGLPVIGRKGSNALQSALQGER